jgi:deoxyribonuclease-4
MFTEKGGEKKHLTFKDNEYGPAFEPLLELIFERGLTPTIVCESDGTQAEDALSMKNYLESLS